MTLTERFQNLRRPHKRIYEALEYKKPEDEVLKLLELPKFNAKEDGGRSLIRASELGYAKVVRKLIDMGAEPNFTEKHQVWTALHSVKSVEIATMLLDAGWDIDAGWKQGKWTPLIAAFYHDEKDTLVPFFIERGANVNAARPYADAPLHEAAGRRSCHHLLQLLLDKGADPVHEVGHSGIALNWARHTGAAENILLLEKVMRDGHARKAEAKPAAQPVPPPAPQPPTGKSPFTL